MRLRPTRPPAAGWFSTMTLVDKAVARCGANMRA
jgi:hypothetical protein